MITIWLILFNVSCCLCLASVALVESGHLWERYKMNCHCLREENKRSNHHKKYVNMNGNNIHKHLASKWENWKIKSEKKTLWFMTNVISIISLSETDSKKPSFAYDMQLLGSKTLKKIYGCFQWIMAILFH